MLQTQENLLAERQVANLIKAVVETGSFAGAAEYFSENNTPFRSLVPVCKEAVAASSETDLLAGAYGDLATSYIPSLRGKSCVDTVGAEAHRVDFHDAVFTANLPVEGSIVLPIPFSKFNLLGSPLLMKTGYGIIAVSRSAFNRPYGREMLMRELAGSIIRPIDSSFFADLITTVGSNTLEATSTGAFSDVKEMLNSGLAATGNESIILFARPELCNSVCTYEGLSNFPAMTPSGGEMCGVRVMATPHLPAADSTGHTVVMVDCKSFAYNPGTVLFATSDAGLVDLDDNPTGSNLVSLFQNDALALKVTRLYGWQLVRSAGVSVMTGVDW